MKNNESEREIFSSIKAEKFSNRFFEGEMWEGE
jgi:hypothetical protein